MYSPRWLFLLPGLCLIIAGLAGMIWLLPGPRRIGGAELDIHSLLASGAAMIIGFQAVIFAVLTRVFAMTERLLPPSAPLQRALSFINLEIGLVAGTLLFLGGVAGAAVSFWSWRDLGFGPLEVSRTMRLFIPSVVAAVVGCQVILASFFLSILGLRRK
jgi:hypothetical protein